MEKGGKRECNAKDPKENASKGTKQGGRQGKWGVRAKMHIFGAKNAKYGRCRKGCEKRSKRGIIAIPLEACMGDALA